MSLISIDKYLKYKKQLLNMGLPLTIEEQNIMKYSIFPH
jgi:hypothetical protein